jgi:WhiB family redox-sensing transcriptional regulator
VSAVTHLLAWHNRAACRTADPALFFPEGDDYATIERAVAVCNGCPARIPCLMDALEHSATSGKWGIRGGETEAGRRNLKRRLRGKAA